MKLESRMGKRWGNGLQGLVAIAIAAIAALPAAAAPSNVAAWSNVGLASQGMGGGAGTAGDFNCDGIADLLVAAPESDVTAGGAAWWTNAGWIGIFYGSSTLPPQPNGTPNWITVGNGFSSTNQTGAFLGAHVAAGDVNRDGCDDVIATTVGNLGAGDLVLVFFGAPGGPSTASGWRRFIGAYGIQTNGSVASGDVNGDGTADIIVGAPEANLGLPNEGAVLVWLGSQFIANVPEAVGNPDWQARGNQIGAALGTSVAAGDVNGDGRDDVIAGAPNWDGSIPNSTDTGITFMWPGSPVFESTADGLPSNASWSLQIGSPSAHLGKSVAVPGDLDGDGIADIVMGAPDYDNTFTTGTQEGTVVATRGRSPAPSTDVFDWFHPGQVDHAHLGFAVASAGDVNGDGKADYLMSEPDVQIDANRRGRVHLLLGRPTASWGVNPVSDVVYSEANSGSAVSPGRYGYAIGTAGDWNNDGFSDVVIGAPWMAGFNGTVFVYLGSGETLASASAFTMRTGQDSSSLGLGLAFAGDINHDGFSDVVAGAPDYEDNPGQSGEGRIFVGYGGSCGPSCPPFFEIIFPGDREGNQAGAQLGRSVDSAGDVNGDGYDDVVAGAPGYDSPRFPCPIGQTCTNVDAGWAFVFYGGGGGLSFSPNAILAGGNQTGSQAGYSVSGAGDVNGDGYGDVIVGAPYYDTGVGADSGRVFLYLGSSTGISTSPSWIKDGTLASARFGISVSGAGDINGDGYSDVIIGADGFGATGAAFVYLGRPTTPTFPQGLSNTPIQTFLGLQAGSSFGVTVASAGDLDRDGFADMVVGAPTTSSGGGRLAHQTGAVHIYHGKFAGPDAAPNRSITGPGGTVFDDANRFGNGVAGAGDVNGDGYGDLAVGDHWFTGPAGFAQGQGYVFHGSSTGIAATSVAGAARTFQDCPTSFCDFGVTVAGEGDANGDGFSDVLFGAFKFTQTANFEGGAFLHLGNDGKGTPLQPLQALGFGGAPRALLGATADWFDASMNLKSPAGRSRVQLELEVKPISQNFDGLNRLTSVNLDNGITTRTALSRFGNPNDVFQWRARLRSASPLFGRSRWVSLPGNAPRQLDIRVLPEPGVAIALMAGAGVLAGLGRRRATRRPSRSRPGAC